MNTYHICGPKAEGSYAEGRRERARLESRRFFITDPSEHDIRSQEEINKKEEGKGTRGEEGESFFDR
ncbi:MAG: hypothetical protein F6K39_20375 [Okeania sp. SIO3B3]|nr:hypothetical protein [Okeania sp. SIO3B3]